MDIKKLEKELMQSVSHRKMLQDNLLLRIEEAKRVMSNYVEMQYEEIADKDIEDILIKVGDTYTIVEGIGIAKNIDPELKINDHTVWLMHCPKGTVISKHTHPNIEYFLVIKGQIAVYYEDEDDIKKGPYYTNNGGSHYIAKDKFHEVEFTEDTSFVIVWYPKL